MARRAQRHPADTVWQIMLKAPRWSQPVPSARRFDNPEAAAFYAGVLIDKPELWTDTEPLALCRLLEAEDPEDVRVIIAPIAAPSSAKAPAAAVAAA